MENRDTEEKIEVQFKKKYLTSHLKSRKYLNELINSARQVKAEGGQVDVQYLRAMCLALKLMLDYFNHAADLKIQEELEELRARMDTIQGVDDA